MMLDDPGAEYGPLPWRTRLRLFWHNHGYLIEQWIAIVILATIGYHYFGYSIRKDRGFVEYLNAHKCEILGKIGVPSQGVYRCDNGLHLENDLRKETGS